MTLYLELTDTALTLGDERGHVRYSEPACAAFSDGALIFGTAAQGMARSHPQQFNNRYLSALNAQALPGPLGPARNFADLLYHHLASLPEINEDLVLIVSSHLTNEQLGLILGICNELKYNVAGFLDLALTHSLTTALPAETQILDLELHRLVATKMITTDGDRETQDPAVWEGRGLAQIMDGWMGMIAAEFVEQTRFDPLHAGASEQQLFDQITAWLGASSASALRVTAGEGSAALNLDIAYGDLAEKLEQRLAGVSDRLNGPIAITHRIQRVHGLTDVLRAHGAEIYTLGDTAEVLRNAASLSQELPRDRTARITRARTATSPIATKAPVSERLATHLLSGDRAWPLAHFKLDEPPLAGTHVTVDQQSFIAILVEDHGP